MESSRLVNESCSRLQITEGSQLYSPAESTRLSSAHHNNTTGKWFVRNRESSR